MGIAERKEREKENRRLEIIAAAESIFFSKGVDDSTMDDIAKHVELSKGTLYLYFKNKEELFLVIVKKALNKLGQMFFKGVEGKKNGLDKFKALGEAFMNFYFNFSDYHKILQQFDNKRVMIKEDNEVYSEIIKMQSGVGTFMIQILEEGIKDGSIKKDIDVKKTAFMLRGASMGVFHLVSFNEDLMKKNFGIEKNELLDYFFKFSYDALKA